MNCITKFKKSTTKTHSLLKEGYENEHVPYTPVVECLKRFQNVRIVTKHVQLDRPTLMTIDNINRIGVIIRTNEYIQTASEITNR